MAMDDGDGRGEHGGGGGGGGGGGKGGAASFPLPPALPSQPPKALSAGAGESKAQTGWRRRVPVRHLKWKKKKRKDRPAADKTTPLANGPEVSELASEPDSEAYLACDDESQFSQVSALSANSDWSRGAVGNGVAAHGGMNAQTVGAGGSKSPAAAPPPRLPPSLLPPLVSDSFASDSGAEHAASSSGTESARPSPTPSPSPEMARDRGKNGRRAERNVTWKMPSRSSDSGGDEGATGRSTAAATDDVENRRGPGSAGHPTAADDSSSSSSSLSLSTLDASLMSSRSLMTGPIDAVVSTADDESSRPPPTDRAGPSSRATARDRGEGGRRNGPGCADAAPALGDGRPRRTGHGEGPQRSAGDRGEGESGGIPQRRRRLGGNHSNTMLRGGISMGLGKPTGGTRANEVRPEDRFRRISEEGVDVVDLHAACETCSSMTELWSVYEEAVETFGARGACAQKDATRGGRLALHCIGLNSKLVFSKGLETSSVLVEEFVFSELITAHPSAVIDEDDSGMIPFTKVLYDWALARRGIREWTSAVDEGETGSKLQNAVRNVISQRKVVSQLPQDDSTDNNKEPCQANDDSADTALRRTAASSVPSFNGLQILLPAESNATSVDDLEQSDIPPMVEWSLRMLSLIIERSNSLGEPSRGETNGAAQGSSSWRKSSRVGMGSTLGSMYSDIVVEKVAAIPQLVQELLLVRDKAARCRVFDLILMRRVLLSEASFGNGSWLTHMLENGSKDSEDAEHSNKRTRLSPRDFAEGAVFYFERISALFSSESMLASSATSGDFGHRGRRTSEYSQMSDTASNYSEYARERLDAMIKICATQVLPNLVLLEDDLTERLAATYFIQQLLDSVMELPIASTMLFGDLIFHALSALAFQFGPMNAMLHSVSKGLRPFDPHGYISWCAALYLCLAYFFVREFNRFIARPDLFWASLSNLWTFVDTVTPFLILCVAGAIDWRLRGLPQADVEGHDPYHLRLAVALTTGALWMKVLGRVKMLNKHLATFVICLFELLMDIKWFLFVLLLVVFAFGQMFVSAMYGIDLGRGPEMMEGVYFRAYTIMLGDFDSSRYYPRWSTKVFFVLYTFTVTVVLLNILIAIVSNSYEKAIQSSQMHFDTIRLHYVSNLWMSIHSYYGKAKLDWKDIALQPSVQVLAAGLAVYARIAFVTAKTKLIRDQSETANEFVGDVFWLKLHSSAFLICALVVFWLFMRLREASYELSVDEQMGSAAELSVPSASSNTSSVKRCVCAIQSFVLRWFGNSTGEDDLNGSGGMAPQKEEAFARIIHEMESIKNQIGVQSRKSDQCLHEALTELKENADQKVLSMEERLQRIESMVAASEDRITRLFKELVEK